MTNPAGGKEPSPRSALEVIEALPIPLERDPFLQTSLRQLAGTIRGVVGLDEASGFVNVVGPKVREPTNEGSRAALNVAQLDRIPGAAVLVDVNQRLEQADERIDFGDRVRPFAEKVADRPAMCMAISNAVGSTGADNRGDAQAGLEKTVAGEDPGCRVVAYLKPAAEAAAATGREDFPG